jgi:hypothetical protein
MSRTEPAPSAWGCTALGCATSEDLQCVTDHEGGQRVLCPECAQDFTEPEVPA